MYRIESFLSARLFVYPQLVGERIYFISNLSGRMSLYAMDHGGSVPEPLLPPQIALQNPHLMGGKSFFVFPKLGKIVVMIDQDGDENYQPMFVPLEGGYPEAVFGDRFKGKQVFIEHCDIERNLAFLVVDLRTEAKHITYLANLETGELTKIDESMYGKYPDAYTQDYETVVLVEGYTIGDHAVFLWDANNQNVRVVYGVPIDEREEGQAVPLNSISGCVFVNDEKSILCHTTLFSDSGGLGYIDLDRPGEIHEVTIEGIQHSGMGEFNGLSHLTGNRYLASFNIDGCDWRYEASYDHGSKQLTLNKVLVGKDYLSNGVVEHLYFEEATDRYVLSFSTATSPTQIHTIENGKILQHTRERILGIPDGLLSAGEDASYTSFDGTRISARLYLPAEELKFEGARPLVYYVHGGPQSQERPDFAWFSMPIIQFLTLSGFAVFVPNVRGSSGYGLSYTKKVDHDWGGDDRLDHVHAMTEVLCKDPRIDTSRAGVVGRSYGGYMTLTLAFRHPELWQGAVDMFGPYDLFTFLDRLPETWKTYFYIALGHPEKDKDFLVERSPRTYMSQLTSPMLVIQGKNDPRVVERESRDVVEQLRAEGKEIEYLMFENEGHDVIKYENRVTCYNAITDFFKKTLKP